MVQVQHIIVTDDLDGSADAETITFGLHGATYEIDLTKANQVKLDAALEPFLNAARKASGPTRRQSSRPRSGGSGGAGPDPKAVRAWAAEQEIDVPARGRIPGALIEQYRAAH